MKFCPTCGSQLREGARFCEGCGTPVAAPPAAGGTPPPAVPTPPPAVPTPPPAVPTPQPAPVPPPAPPVAEAPPAQPAAHATDPQPAYATAPQPVAPKSRRTLITGIGGIAAVAVLGVVGYVVVDQLTGASGGADSPEAAVLELSAAANGEDAATALSLLPPGEVGPIVDLYRDVESKATSTGIAAKDAPLAGFDVRLDGVTVQTEQLGEDVAAVTVTSGTVSWAVDPGQMQGALRIDSDGDVRNGAEGSADLVEVSREATDGAPLRIMTVQRDGAWYVSPSYTLLEAWRATQGLPAPDFSKELDLEGTGADSATAAVQEAVQAAASYDVDALLDLLSPDEAAALYQYRDAITTALHRDGALAELQSEGRLEVVSLDAVEGDEVDGRVPVTVRSASGGVYDDDGDHVSWTLDRNCLSWNDGRDSEGGCLDEIFAETGLSTDLAGRFDALTLLTQEVDGRWYLAPMATAVSEVREGVAALDADTVAAMLGVPQFGGVDGTLEEGVTTEASTAGWPEFMLYEMDVPAGSVVSTCADDDVTALLYGPDGRLADGFAVLAPEGGRHRVVVNAQEAMSFGLTPAFSTVEEVTVPSTVPAAGGDACGWRMVSFEATAGQPLTFTAENRSNLHITTPSGETVWGSAFVPEESGTHLLSVPADQQVAIELLPDDVLLAGDSTTFPLGPNAEQSLRVFVAEGQNVDIEVTAMGGGVPYVLLYSPDDDLVDRDSGSYFYGGASVSPYSYEPGVYQLFVTNDWGGDDTFQVTVYE